MISSIRPVTLLKIWLWLMAIHSFAVGLGLIWHPATLLGNLGYNPCSEPFFPIQGGVFHIVMSVCYSMAIVLAVLYHRWKLIHPAKEQP